MFDRGSGRSSQIHQSGLRRLRNMTHTTDGNRIPIDRTVQRAIPKLTEEHEITVRAEGETFSGPVVRIDAYSDSVDVNRVVQFNITYKHHIDGTDWEPWKVYLIEEPADCYRVNVVLYNGDKSRTHNLDQPDEIEITLSK